MELYACRYLALFILNAIFISLKITLTICFPVPPVVSAQVLPPDSSVVVSGSAVQLTCIVSSGDLGISFSWSDPAGAAISPSPINDTASVISITPMMSSQYGTYTCVASNRFGNGSDTVIITEAGTKECHCIVY